MAGIERKQFSEIDLNDSFFDSLKEDYKGFQNWYERKSATDTEAYVISQDGKIDGFLYLKIESKDEIDTSIEPPLPTQIRLKLGTFKVNPHRTRLGERFIKITIDEAINKDINLIYVTVFSKHTGLISLLCEFGFKKISTKTTSDGEEEVYLKDLSLDSIDTTDVVKNYPIINIQNSSKYLLSIFPDYHTELFPDSKLQDESDDIIQDISHTNSIHKIYISWAEQAKILQRGDILVFYRTSDIPGRAYYRAVATSIGTVEEVKTQNDFTDVNEFINYCKSYSIFDHHNLEEYYKKTNLTTIKFLYNTAFKKKIIRKFLMENVHLNGEERWTLLKLSEDQFLKIIELSKIKTSIIKR